jgi:hypothetical protein
MLNRDALFPPRRWERWEGELKWVVPRTVAGDTTPQTTGNLQCSQPSVTWGRGGGGSLQYNVRNF